tara:strand:+ start:792 stop:1148 length:357 start_codon:yes stop_codon:yes gene_type:complete
MEQQENLVDYKMRYLFHNIYGDAQSLLDTLPSDVEAIPWGWDEETETARNNKIVELNNVVVGELPSLVFWREAWDSSFEVNGETFTTNHPAQWWTVSFSELEGDWTWENMDKSIKDNT